MGGGSPQVAKGQREGTTHGVLRVGFRRKAVSAVGGGGRLKGSQGGAQSRASSGPDRKEVWGGRREGWGGPPPDSPSSRLKTTASRSPKRSCMFSWVKRRPAPRHPYTCRCSHPALASRPRAPSPESPASRLSQSWAGPRQWWDQAASSEPGPGPRARFQDSRHSHQDQGCCRGQAGWALSSVVGRVRLGQPAHPLHHGVQRELRAGWKPEPSSAPHPGGRQVPDGPPDLS